MACVLQIEDNEQNRYLATFLLTKAGFRVIEAVDGASALRLLAQSAPDLIIVDIQLPGIDGYETARRIRGMRAFATTPLIAVTSYAMPVDRERARHAGFGGYIEKPIEPETFARQIAAYLA